MFIGVEGPMASALAGHLHLPLAADEARGTIGSRIKAAFGTVLGGWSFSIKTSAQG